MFRSTTIAFSCLLLLTALIAPRGARAQSGADAAAVHDGGVSVQVDAGAVSGAAAAQQPAPQPSVADAGTGAALSPVAVTPDTLAEEEAEASAAGPKEARAPGSIRGVVISAEDDAPIADALVFVRSTLLDTHADASGGFHFNLAPGTYQVTVILPGFATQTVSDIKVRSGKETEVTVKLTSGSMTLDEFVVVGARLRGGIASLIAERRQSTAVADLIGSEQMTRSGSSNAAAALARVTGLTVVDGKYVIVRGMGERYSSLLVNNLLVPSPEPTRRVVPLDLFPAGVLESVVVQKSFSPDSQGEFGGGVVQLRTRAYPDRFTLNLSVAGGYNTQTTFRNNFTYAGGNYDFLGIDDGTRALPSDIHRAKQLIPKNVLTGDGYSDEELAKLGKQLPANYRLRKERTLPDLTFFASVGNRWQLRHAKIGFVAAGGYRSQTNVVRNQLLANVLRDQNTGVTRESEKYALDTFLRQIALTGFLDWGVEFSPEHKLKFTSMILRQTDDSDAYRVGGRVGEVGPNTVSRRTRLGWIERQLFSQQASGRHVFPSLHDFEINWRYSYALSSRAEPDRRDYVFGNTADGTFLLSGLNGDTERWFAELTDGTHQAGLDLLQPFRIWQRLTAKAKVGAFVLFRKRDSRVRTFEYGFVANGVPQVEQEQGPDVALRPDNIGNGVSFSEATRASDSYKAEMQLQAGYAMLELPVVKQFDLMGGARVERGFISVNSFDQFDPNAKEMFSRLNKVDVLPAATATLRMPRDLQLRGAYNRTVNRPDLRELSEQAYFDIELNATTKGNPDLKRAVIDSGDLRLEWYLTPDEVFSVGGFVKKIESPIEVQFIPSADGNTYTLLNSKQALLLGLELEGRKRFGFLHKKLNPLFLAANFSWISSRVDFELRAPDGISMLKRHRPLQSQSPWVVNAQFGYDDDVEGGTGTAVSLLYNVFGPRLRAVGDANTVLPQPDQYEQPFHQLDVVASQRLPRGFTFGLRGQNLLNATQRWKAGGVDTRRFKRGVYITANLAWSY